MAPAEVIRPKPPGPGKVRNLSAKEADALWEMLAGAEYAVAFQSMLQLLDAPEDAVRLCARHLKPVQTAEPQRVRELIAQLADPKFAVREKASNELTLIAELGLPLLRAALKEAPSAEAQRRLKELIGIGERPIDMRALRMVAILEAIGTKEACAALEQCAVGASGASLTLEAKAALERVTGPDGK